jgi:hypothetical protein
MEDSEPKLPPRDPEPDPLNPAYPERDPDGSDPDLVPETDPPYLEPQI